MELLGSDSIVIYDMRFSMLFSFRLPFASVIGEAGEKGEKGAPGRPGRVGPPGEKGRCLQEESIPFLFFTKLYSLIAKHK